MVGGWIDHWTGI